MAEFSIDLDAEAVFLDGTWYTSSDLSRRIKAMIDSGDYNVARPSLALEELTQEVQQARTLAFRCTPELAEALSQLAARIGQTPNQVLREALTQFITDANSGTPATTAPGWSPPPVAQAAPPPQAPATSRSGGFQAAPAQAPATSRSGGFAAATAPAPPRSGPHPVVTPVQAAPPKPQYPPSSQQPVPQYPVAPPPVPEPPEPMEPLLEAQLAVEDLIDVADMTLDVTSSTHEELPKVIVEPAIAVVPVAGPGALRAAGVSTESPDRQRHPGPEGDTPGRQGK